jgi:hypothetical protein
MTVGTATRPDTRSAGATEQLVVPGTRPADLPLPAAEMVRLQATELERLRREHAAWRAEVADRVRFRRTAARAATLEALAETRAACAALETAVAATEREGAWRELRRLQAAVQELTLYCARGGLADPGPPNASVSDLLGHR